MYDHLNNSMYGLLYVIQVYLFPHVTDSVLRFDAIINAYLIENCGLHPPTATITPLVVHSSCNFFGSVAYPSVVDCGLRVSKLGKSSVTYEVGVFERGADDVRAVGGFTHVYVDRKSNRPLADGMPAQAREALQRLCTQIQSKL